MKLVQLCYYPDKVMMTYDNNMYCYYMQCIVNNNVATACTNSH